ncbi:uncharacterized protein LOC115325393 [Ixodes scapularis]|uniref:uncharacterized protein LOC115325393 n=1 Tax=Ixodes scapularis TaxID=6945 RepID=UPI001A9F6442|nr:uncharacterized protein LOC115325393 [Ixodes scapularis]
MSEEQKDETDQRQPIARASSGENAEEKVENNVEGDRKPRKTPFGPIRNPTDVSRTEWSFVAFSLLGLAISIGITSERLATLPKGTDDLTFAIMLFWSNLACIWHLCIGVAQQLAFDIIVFIVSAVVLEIYLIVNLTSTHEANLNLSLTYVRFGLATFFFLGILAFSGLHILPSYCKQTTWLVYRVSGKNETQQRIHIFCSSLTLIMLDVQLQASMIILVMDTGVYLSTFDICVIVVGSFILLGWACAGVMARNKESKRWLVVFGILLLPNLVYVIFRMQEIARETARESWSILRHAIFVCGSLALVTRLAAAFCMILVVRNFGKNINQMMVPTEAQKNTPCSRQLEVMIPEGGPDSFVP